MQILVDINLKDFRGEEGDDGESMMNVYGTIKNINLRDFEIRSANKNFTQDTYDNMETTIETFFIMAQSVVNKDFLRYPYKIPVSVLEIVTVEKAKAYLSPNFGLITA